MLKKLPKECDICRDRIGLYKPFYTLLVDSKFTGFRKKTNELTVLCPECFYSFKNYLNSREEFFIYQKAKDF